MRFQVPQFIEVEDKIFGPLTGKQFVYLAGAAGVSFILWTLLPNFLAILLGAPVVILALALAFYKVNNRPFITVLESAFNYAVGNKLYIWQKHDRAPTSKAETKRKEGVLMHVPKLTQSKLKDLAWSLDIKESRYAERPEHDTMTQRNYGNEI